MPMWLKNNFCHLIRMVLKKNKILTFLFCLLCNVAHAQQTEKIYLSGTGNDNTKVWEFYCTEGMNSGKWTTIPVPSLLGATGFWKIQLWFCKR
jgi:hypothetical protein